MVNGPSSIPSPRDPSPEGPLEDGTLGGYFRYHNRPPAFQGSDEHPYTVSPETEKTPNLLAPFAGYLVFPRWAMTGAGIVGHLETGTLVQGTTPEEVEARLGALTLLEVQELLEQAILQEPPRAEHA